MFQQNNITPGIGELIKGPQQSQAQTPSPLESEDHHIVREQHRLDREERAKITLWKKPITTLAYFVLETWVILVGWCHRWDEVWDHRPVCFNFERAGAPRHFLLGKGHHMKKFLLGKHLRALRQWPVGMEAIAFVASMKYQAWDQLFCSSWNCLYTNICTTSQSCRISLLAIGICAWKVCIICW